ncbi:Translation initiation factor IF-2 chloroplastic [Bienertia sinuspersici]
MAGNLEDPIIPESGGEDEIESVYATDNGKKSSNVKVLQSGKKRQRRLSSTKEKSNATSGHAQFESNSLASDEFMTNMEEEKDDTPIPSSEDVASPHQSSSTMLA